MVKIHFFFKQFTMWVGNFVRVGTHVVCYPQKITTCVVYYIHEKMYSELKHFHWRLVVYSMIK